MVALHVDNKKTLLANKMKIPPDFEPDNLLRKGLESPPPKRPRTRKCDLYSGPSRFRHVDDHVNKVTTVNHKSFRGLLWHLLFCDKDIKSDLDRVRAIYRWTAATGGVKQCFENNPSANTAEEYITKFQSGKISHAQILQLLCIFAGLHCKIITGCAKGKTFRPGDACSEERFRHCWNAVYFDGNWFLLDAKWGAINGNNNTSECSEFYFLTDPEQLQFSHWAEDPRWQLVDRPIAMNEFENYPFVKPHFFRVGLNFISNVKCVIETRRGQVKWDIGVTHPAKFSYRLVSSDTGSDKIDGVLLKNFIFHEVQNGRATFALRSPAPGDYFLKIFAKSLHERNGHTGYTRMLEVLEYRVQISKTCIEDDPLPNCWDTTWGPGQRTDKFCLYPLQKRGLIATDEKTVDIEINKTRPVNILCRLCRNGWKESKLQKCIEIEDNDTKSFLTVTLPYAGEYGLEIYGCLPSRKTAGFHHVCQYLISCSWRDENFTHEDLEKYVETTEAEDAVFENKELEIKPAIYSDNFQLPVLKIDESSLPEPSPRPLDLMQASPSIGWSLELEDHVKSVCDRTYRSFDTLLKDLVFSRNIQNDTVKARILFQWLATMKPQNLTFDSVDIGSPEETLRGLQTQRTTYAMAYNTLCKYSGLVSKIIFGVAKGMDYKPGNTFTPGSNHHTWNAVLLNGVWELVDTRFAKRPVLAGATGGPSMQYEFDDHFFMTNPQKFIYTHFPDESKWQMLDPLVTMETFCNMPVMTPHFFALGMDLLSHKLAYVHSTGKSIIELNYPKSKRLHLTFSVISDNGTEEYEGVKLVRYAMLEANAGKVTFRLRLPVKGKYTFIVYAKEDNPKKSDNVFAQVCEYIIEQEDIMVPKPFPYPPCAYQSWGPGIAFYQFNLSTDTVSAVIKTKKGVAKFEIMSSKPMQFRTRLVQHQETSEFEGYVTHKIQGNLTMFTITAPSQGEFGLEIYAKDPDTESKKMRHVAQYLILCEEEIHTVQLPKLPSGFLGLQPMLVKYGVSTITHSDPVIHTDTNYLEIRFGTSQNMRFTTSLFETETQAEYSEYVFIQSEMNVITLLVCLPKTGFFTFCVHGNLLTDNSQQIPGLFNYLIHCNEMKVDAIPYPKQYGFWKEGCSMMKPLAIKPVQETTVAPFKVRIPRATIVAVVVDNDWTPLVLHPESGAWEGDIHIEPTSQGGIKVVLVASFGDDQSKYATLLEYKL